jgi:anti-sigma regulatory factor (Ser/Thr protein kinase)
MSPRSKDASPGEHVRRARRPARGAGAPTRVELTLARNVQAPSLARNAIAERADALGLDRSLAQSLILLVSEVVSNAVRHSKADPKAPVELLATFGEKAIRVTVTDAGDGFIPQPRDPARTHDGYGLYLLEKVAERWGVESGGDTRVWFEMAPA